MNAAEYLIKKLEEMGITDFFGLPGDYNFNILSAIENNPNTNWIGCTSELNAGYAADGYARQKGFGALVTTHGVGELSAINAIMGSFAENIPVIHIVGAPSSEIIKSETIFHHNFQEPRHQAFKDAYKLLFNSESAVFLRKDGAKLEIDRVLKIFYKERRPVYIAIPSDVALEEVSERNIDYNWVSNSENLETVTNLISEKINKSYKPVILADTLIKRFDAKQAFVDFTEKSGIPVTNFLMGTGIINSDYKNYAGTYLSKYGNTEANRLLKETDCLIAVGAIYSDVNSFGANLQYKINSHIAIYGTYTYIEGKKYDNIKMSDVLNGITKLVKHRKTELNNAEQGYCEVTPTRNKLNSDYIYSRLQKFIRGEDTIITESGLIPHGIFRMKFPENVELHSQLLWGSIGWATAATLGVCIASQKSRVILITGEGAHQISAMEIGNMCRYGLKPIIIVINNSGYGTERLLSGNSESDYNNIMQMDYPKFARAFKGNIWSTSVSTEDDFDKALRVTQIMDKLCYIEAVTDKEDFPKNASMLNGINLAAKSKCKKNEEEWITAPEGKTHYETSVHTSLKDFEI